MSRRRKVVLSIVGLVGAAIGGLAIAFFLSSPLVGDLPIDVEAKEIPPDWVSEDAAPERTVDASSDPASPYVSTGKLSLIGNGKPFGEEAYRLTISEDRATLSSTGRFWFKVVLATVRVTFEQTFEGDGDLRPIAYAAEFHAPLGFDRTIHATAAGDRLTIERSDGAEQIPIDLERAFMLGTFSTYALLPRLFALRQEAGSASFEVLVFGGAPNQGADDSAADDLPVMTIERVGSASLRAGATVLQVDRYVVSSDLGESELFARGDEFLALRAGDEDGSILVYRADFFPDGVEIVNATP